MSLHDKLAYKASSMGKSASEFSAAAQKHANTTWFLLIVAGVVWYFANWIWALIPAGIGIFTALQSISSTMIASKLEKTEQK